MVDHLKNVLNNLHVLLRECSHIIRGGWTSKQGREIDAKLIKMGSWVTGLIQKDPRVKLGAIKLAGDLKTIRERLDAGEYQTGEIFLRKLKSILVYGLREMIQILRDGSEYKVLITDLQKVA